MHGHAPMPLPDCCALIVNPTSGKYCESDIRSAMDAFATVGLSPQLFITRTASDAPRIAGELCERYSSPLIIAGGGDGTINGVVNGMVPGKAVLAVLPLGTANVLAKELGISSVDDAVRRVVRGESRLLSLGVVKGERYERRFLLMAGAGFDARVVNQVRDGEKRALKQGAYMLAALRCLASWERELLDVSFGEGGHIRCHSVVVCNAARYGGAFRLAPEATVLAPGFCVVCVVGSSRWDYLRLSMETVSDRMSRHPCVRRIAAGSVTITGRKDVQVDGDYLGLSPVRVEALPDFSRIIV